MTTLIALAVIIVPGAILGFTLPPGRYRWAAWVAAPALTLGLTTMAMAWLPDLGLPHSAGAVLVAELVLAGVIVGVSRLVPRGLVPDEPRSDKPGSDKPGSDKPGSDSPAPDEPGPDRSLAARLRLPAVRPRRADLIGVAVPAVMSVTFGWLMLGRLVAPPGWDAMNHGYLTRRILDTDSATIAAACTTGSTETVASCAFYPLAANVSWAQAAQLSGGQIGAVMTAWAIVLGPLAMVAGVYACVRALGGHPVVAACAAAAPTFLGPMWLAMITGRVTGQTAPCLAGGIALLIALALRGPHPVRLGLLAGLASAGMVMTHTYDVLFIAVLAVGLLFALRGALTARTSSAALAAASVAGAATLLPFLDLIIGANDERLAGGPTLPGDVPRAVWYWLVDPQRYVLLGYPAPGGGKFQLGVLTIQIGLVLTVTCLLASPLCLFLPQLRWARPWFIAGGVFSLIGVWTTTSDSAAALALSSLWYGVRERVRVMILPAYGVIAVAGAVAIAIMVRRLVRRLDQRTRARHRASRLAGTLAGTLAGRLTTALRVQPGHVGAVVLVLSLAMLAAVPSSWRPLRRDLARSAPVGQAYVDAFEWLAENTSPGKVVAYDRHLEFMTWSYVDHGTALLFGIPPLGGPNTRNYSERWAAWHWLANSDGAKPAGCQVRRFGIEYVVTGKRRMPRVTSVHYDRDRLERSDRITLVHQIGEIKIYRVNELGSACPEPT